MAILAPEAVVGWAITATGAGTGAFFSSSEELLDSDSEMSWALANHLLIV